MGLGENYLNFKTASVLYYSRSARLTQICNETVSLAAALGSFVNVTQVER